MPACLLVCCCPPLPLLALQATGNQKGLTAEAACLLYYSLVNMPTEIEDVPVCLRARHPCAPMPHPVAQWPAAATTPLALQVWQ